MDSPDLKDFGTLLHVLVNVAEQQSLQAILDAATEGLCEDRPHIVHACIWQFEEFGDQGKPFLHLTSSARKKTSEGEPPWSRSGSPYVSVPLDEPLIGAVAGSGKRRFALNPESWPGGYPDWAEQCGVLTYIAEPIRHQDKLLGVIAVFADVAGGADRARLDEGLHWLRLFTGVLAANITTEDLQRQLQYENEYLRAEVHDAHGFGDIIGESDALKETLSQVDVVAPTEANVLITGESGTGKELIARAVHERSLRTDRPLIKVNCASIPDNLFESEFFGHARGSFTGAIADRQGRFQLADEGTLFLDEVGEIPLDLQGKLLRVLQEGTFERIGEDRTRKVNVRVIAATNRDLEEEVRENRFREDLFYRLSVFPIRVAPLRERLEDVPLLARHFLKKSIRQLLAEKIRLRFTEPQLARLTTYSWPGNVRELQNIVQRAVIQARAGNFEVQIPQSRPAPDSDASPEQTGTVLDSAGALHAEDSPATILTEQQMRDLEAANISRALDQAGGKISGPGGAAELLGINAATLSSRVKKMQG